MSERSPPLRAQPRSKKRLLGRFFHQRLGRSGGSGTHQYHQLQKLADSPIEGPSRYLLRGVSIRIGLAQYRPY
eukprot:SAG25_NODE_9903_length_353_cov_0.783465_1_plen_72_part_10